MDTDRCKDAVAAYERALAIRFDADVATDRGVCLARLGDRERAAAAFEFVTIKDPSHWKARYNLTALLTELGRIDDARESLAVLERQRADEEARMRTLRQALGTSR